MPKFASAIDTQRIPVKGLIPETSGTAPTGPSVGQLWVDTSVTPRVLRVWDGAVWAPLNIYTGTTAGTFAAGDDSRITGAAQKSANLSDLGSVTTARTNLGLGTAATLNSGTGAANLILGNDSRLTDQRTPIDSSVTDTKVAAANKDGLPAVPSMRTLGTGAQQAAAGNDARFTDQRTPLDNSVTAVKIVDGTITDAEIATANKDGAVGVASLRTLGFGATQALAGNTKMNQLGAATGNIDFGGQRGINVGAPVANTDLARLVDVQNAIAGLDPKASVRVRAASNVSVTSAPAAIDGVTLTAGDRVLLTGQTTTTENDIWVFNGAAAAMTRSTDTITPNSFLFVEEGTSADSQWIVTNNGTITRGTTTIVWTQFGAATNYAGTANRITVTGTSIDISASYVGQNTITTLGTVTTGTWNGTAVAIPFGGTGATDAAGARTNLNVPQRGYAADLVAITAGATVTVAHGLGTQDVIAQVREVATQTAVEIDITNTSVSQVSVRSDVAYAAGALRIVILPVA